MLVHDFTKLMAKMSECLATVDWYLNMDLALNVVPVQSDATIFCVLPILSYFIMLFQYIYQMVYIFLAYVLHNKIINYEGEADGSCGMLPRI